ncbi:MAG: hypothetical protein C0402_09765 [Thermodesulfovibrio sp.]|nr:hypothetical protein [Thermodesulfovibrio sp.]
MILRTIPVTMLIIFLLTTLCSADCNTGDRYEDNSNGTVTDCRTGLIWLQNANCTTASGGVLPGVNGFMTWTSALKWAAGLGDGLCSLSDGSAAGDWRLPTKTEWMAMIASAKRQVFQNPVLTDTLGTSKWTTNGNAFNNVQSSVYWSQTPRADFANFAWYISLSNGFIDTVASDSTLHVWPVRGGQVGSFGYLFIE